MSKDWTFDALNHSSFARRCLWLDFNVQNSMALAVHSGPNVGTNTQKTMASGANISWQNADVEPGASDGWFMGQDSLSLEEESTSIS